MYLLGGQHLTGVDLPGIQDLAAQRHDGLELLVPGLFGTATGRVPLHQKQFRATAVLTGTIGQLAGQRRPLGDALALDLLARLEPTAGVVDGHFGNLLTDVRMLVQPQAEGILDHPGHKGSGFTRGQALLGLPGKLRLGHLHRQHVADPLPDILRRQLDAPGQQVAEFAELADGLQQPRTQAVDVGTALGGGDQVDVAFLYQLAALRLPEQRPVDRLLARRQSTGKGLHRQCGPLLAGIGQIVAQTILVVPTGLFPGLAVIKLHLQPRTQHRLGLEQVQQAVDIEFGCIEVAAVGPELYRGAGVAFANGADHFQFVDLVAVFEGDGVFLAVSPDPHFQPQGQGVDHRDTDPVQTTGKLVVLAGELAPGVQPREDQFDPGHPFFGVDIHRHTAPIVDHFQCIVLMQDHRHAARMTGQRLVDAVVYDFLGQVVGSGGIGVHARAATHRVQTAEYFNIIGVIGRLGHRVSEFP